MSRNTRALIDLGALRHNLALARRSAPQSRVMAVIKSNAYGHGLLAAARALRAADAFAVCNLAEAVPLREAGFAQPILLLQGLYDEDDLAAAERYRLDLVVHSLWQVEILERARCRPLDIWLKVESGMHRLGLPAATVADAYARLRSAPAVGTLRLMTHLAAADDRRSDFTSDQLRQFEQACAGLPGERSIANSAGLLAWPAARAEWIRPGIMLYGASPFADDLPERPDLRPVMTLTSQLVAINHCRRGDRIGYAGTFECPQDMPVGIVTIGYGDGYPRHAGTGAPVLVNAQRTQLLGRVSMDMLCVDLRGVAASVHDPVTLWGRGLPIEALAEAAGTIPYELVCKITGRVEFSYTEGEDGEGAQRL
jgi:alanine racemase